MATASSEPRQPMQPTPLILRRSPRKRRASKDRMQRAKRWTGVRAWFEARASRSRLTMREWGGLHLHMQPTALILRRSPRKRRASKDRMQPPSGTIVFAAYSVAPCLRRWLE
jgi:hypothetical protein